MIHGKNALNVFQRAGSRVLARFPNHCITKIELCDKGLTVEFWLWFSYTHAHLRTTILASGYLSKSRGFWVYLKYHHVCMEIAFWGHDVKTCVGPLGQPTDWLHVLAHWDAGSDTITLIGMT